MAGVSDPEAKRKIIGRLFIEVFVEEGQILKDVSFLGLDFGRQLLLMSGEKLQGGLVVRQLFGRLDHVLRQEQGIQLF
jgi:hypothetical protein